MCKLFVIIPVHNRYHFTRKCIESLYQKSAFDEVQIVVVDDGSMDGTKEKLNEEFPSVKVIQGDGNLWWTRSINKGLDLVLSTAKDSDFVLTMNNDVEVSEGYLNSLLEAASKLPGAIIGSLNIDIEDKTTIYDGGVLIKNWNAKYTYMNKGKSINKMTLPPDNLVEVSVLPGRGMLIPVPVFKHTGYFDSAVFPQYFADYDFSLRAKRNGYNLVVSYASIVYSYIAETGLKSDKKYFKEFFFSTKSPANIVNRLKFSSRISQNILEKTLYTMFDLARNIYAFVLIKIK